MREKLERPAVRGRKDRPPPKGAQADPEQLARFAEASRELGCDESPEAFVRAVRRIARGAPVRQTPAPPASGDQGGGNADDGADRRDAGR